MKKRAFYLSNNRDRLLEELEYENKNLKILNGMKQNSIIQNEIKETKKMIERINERLNKKAANGLLIGLTDKNNGVGITVETPEGKIIAGGGEIIMCEEASTKNCEELSKMNVEGGGDAIPCDLIPIANTGTAEKGTRIERTHYEEAHRYIENAKETLKKSGVSSDGKYYEDTKYVKSAAGIAYAGAEQAIKWLAKIKGVELKSRDVWAIKDFLSKVDGKMLKSFITVYETLHKNIYYGNETLKKIVDAAIDGAEILISYLKPYKQVAIYDCGGKLPEFILPYRTGIPVDIIAYHASDGDVKFGKGGAFFAPEAITEYGQHALKVKLKFNNPLVVDDRVDAAEILLPPRNSKELKYLIEEGKITSMDEFANYDILISNAAKKAGYDGIIYNEPNSYTSKEYVALYRNRYKIISYYRDIISGNILRRYNGGGKLPEFSRPYNIGEKVFVKEHFEFPYGDDFGVLDIDRSHDSKDSFVVSYIFIPIQYRGKKHSFELLEFAKQYAEEMGYSKVEIRISDDEKQYEKLKHIYQKAGFIFMPSSDKILYFYIQNKTLTKAELGTKINNMEHSEADESATNKEVALLNYREQVYKGETMAIQQMYEDAARKAGATTEEIRNAGYSSAHHGAKINGMENLPKNIEKFLSQFPDNATSWRYATDEIRDMARVAREYYNELTLDVLNDDAQALKPLNFRGLKTPSEWNTQGKNYIRETYAKMDNQTKKQFNDWFETNFSNSAQHGAKIDSPKTEFYYLKIGNVVNEPEFNQHYEIVGLDDKGIKFTGASKFIKADVEHHVVYPYFLDRMNSGIASIEGKPYNKDDQAHNFLLRHEIAMLELLSDVAHKGAKIKSYEDTMAGMEVMAEKGTKIKNKYTFIDVLNNPEGRYIVEAIEELDANTKDEIIIEMRKNLIQELKDKFGYTYILNASQGARIENQYKDKYPAQIWNEWKKEQREHFLKDHKDELGVFYEENFRFINNEWTEIPRDVKDVVVDHVYEGQYSGGGRAAKGAKVGGKKYRVTFDGEEGLPVTAILTNPEIKAHLKKHKGIAMIKKEEIKAASEGIKIKKLSAEKNFWHARLHSPKGAEKCATPEFASTIAETIHEGSKVTTCKFNGEWLPQTILIPKAGVGKKEARNIAEKIASKLQTDPFDKALKPLGWKNKKSSFVMKASEL